MRKLSKRTGFSLVELLVSLALMAMLLAAVATAIHASFSSYTENDKMAATTQAARAILHRLSGEIRTAESVSSTDTALTIIQTDGAEVQYEFEDGTLYYRRTVSDSPITHVLLGSDDELRLTAFSVVREEGPDAQGVNCTKSVTVRMTFAIANRSFSVTSTADVRRNQDY